ncbi:hypothetical protein [Rheinheimera sp. SA_1]|nr:hypothetical protein [Rheinheimera sp. SA_1]
MKLGFAKIVFSAMLLSVSALSFAGDEKQCSGCHKLDAETWVCETCKG